MKTFAERLAHLRNTAGLSQGDLVRLAGLKGRSHVSSFESGHFRPSYPTARALAATLGCTIDYLLDGGDGPGDEEVCAAVALARANVNDVKEAG